jgi:uncharacterized protein
VGRLARSVGRLAALSRLVGPTGLVGLAAALVFGIPAPARAELPVPELTGRIVDRAGLLPADEARALEVRLAAFERETSHQIVVLTLPSLEGEAIESFSIRVADRWKIGQKGLDNGVIVFVAAEDRRARIEVGYGLEGVIPDAVAARILRERMIPEFRRGAMDAGIVAGVDALMAVARGEVMAEPGRSGRPRAQGAGGFVHAILFGTVFGAVAGAFAGRRRPVRRALVSGSIAAGIAYLFTFAVLAAVVAAVMGALFGLAPSGSGLGPGRRGPYGPYGGWGGGGGFGGGLGGGFGGGFGGGGGGFGGGGASGSW